MRVSYYERVEHDSPFGVEDVNGSREIAERISSSVCSELEDYVPESFEGSHFIHFIDVIFEDGVVSVDGVVLDVEDGMYDEEALDEVPYHCYQLSFNYNPEEELS